MINKIYAVDDRERMEVSEIVRQSSALLLRGRLAGTMPITAKLTPRELRAALRLSSGSKLFFIRSFYAAAKHDAGKRRFLRFFAQRRTEPVGLALN